ncbi:hypothetical protein Plhal304r1_c022g0077521 [Plasmopara halstedii]
MRVPAFSFILQLFAAVSLLVDVLVALSTMSQTLRNDQRNVTDRQLGAQDSRARRKVTGDDFPSRPNKCDILPGRQFFQKCATNKKLLLHYWNNDKSHSDFVARMEAVLLGTNDDIRDELISNFNTAWNSIKGGKLKSENGERGIGEADWKSILDHLIHFGFSRKEVEVLLRTAGFSDVKQYMDSYDQVMSAMPPADILDFVDLNSETAVSLIDKEKNYAERSMVLLASIASVGQASSSERFDVWKTAVSMWISAGFREKDLRDTLDEYAVPKGIKTGILNIFASSISHINI